MTLHRNRLEALAKPRSEAAIERAEYRKKNREWLRMSQEIALNIHCYLRSNEMSQKDFAEKLNVSPVYVAKLLKGGENLTLETISKLEAVMSKSIISIAKPYMMQMRVLRHEPLFFSSQAVTSEKYQSPIQSLNKYVTADGSAA